MGRVLHVYALMGGPVSKLMYMYMYETTEVLLFASFNSSMFISENDLHTDAQATCNTCKYYSSSFGIYLCMYLCSLYQYKY